MIEIPDFFQSSILPHTPGQWRADPCCTDPNHTPETWGVKLSGPTYVKRPTNLKMEDGQLAAASPELLRFVETDLRVDNWLAVVNERHSRSDNPMTDEEFWEHTERCLPELAAACLALTEEQLAERAEEEAHYAKKRGEDPIPETPAEARCSHWGVHDDDGEIWTILNEWLVELRRRALEKTYGARNPKLTLTSEEDGETADEIPGPAFGVLIAVGKGLEKAPARGKAIDILVEQGLIAAFDTGGGWNLSITEAGRAYLAARESAGV